MGLVPHIVSAWLSNNVSLTIPYLAEPSSLPRHARSMSRRSCKSAASRVKMPNNDRYSCTASSSEQGTILAHSRHRNPPGESPDLKDISKV